MCWGVLQLVNASSLPELSTGSATQLSCIAQPIARRAVLCWLLQALSSAKHDQCGLTTQLQAARQQADDARSAAERALIDCKEAAAAALNHAAAEMAQLKQDAAQQLHAAQQEAQQLQEALAEVQRQLDVELQQKQQLQQHGQELEGAQVQQLGQLQQLQQDAAQHLERLNALQAQSLQLAAAANKR